ncbi:Histone RNA hairpin-binding protein [Diplonema papillatum]|nr:Histone RNA hairpin-binding protein [Diplonema papillatum]
MTRQYSREFLLSVRNVRGPQPDLNHVPDVFVGTVERPKVKSKFHDSKQKQADGSPVDAPAAHLYRKADPGFLGPEERAKLEEIQRLVRQQKPKVRRRSASEDRPVLELLRKNKKDKSDGTAGGSGDADPARWEKLAGAVIKDDEPAGGKSPASLNPNAAPFLPPSLVYEVQAAFMYPPMMMMPMNQHLSPDLVNAPEYSPPSVNATVPDSQRTNESAERLAPEADEDQAKRGEAPESPPSSPSLASENDSFDDVPWGSDIDLPEPPPGTKAKKGRVETDEWRLKQRQKQVQIGLRTVGYKNYVRAKETGKDTGAEMPRIPNVYQVCSKRAWDGQIRRWRQLLHKFDDMTEELWDEEEVKKLQKITEKHEKFRQKVRRQQDKAVRKAVKDSLEQPHLPFGYYPPEFFMPQGYYAPDMPYNMAPEYYNPCWTPDMLNNPVQYHDIPNTDEADADQQTGTQPENNENGLKSSEDPASCTEEQGEQAAGADQELPSPSKAEEKQQAADAQEPEEQKEEPKLQPAEAAD